MTVSIDLRSAASDAAAWQDEWDRRRGVGRSALREVEEWLREHGADRALATLDPEDPAQLALFRHGTVSSQRMALSLGSRGGSVTLPDELSWRPMTPSEYPAWLAAESDGFARQNAESGTLSAEAARERSEQVFAQLLPDGLETPDHSFTVLEDAGGPLAWLWLRHHHRQGHSFVFSVTVKAGQRGKGYGRAIML